LADDLVTIEAQAFHNCRSLRGVTVPLTCLTIGQEGSALCEVLAVMDLWEGLRGIKERAFLECISLNNVSIPITAWS